MKLVVNLVLGLHRAVLAEGLAFARRAASSPRRRSASSRQARVFAGDGDQGPQDARSRFEPASTLRPASQGRAAHPRGVRQARREDAFERTAS